MNSSDDDAFGWWSRIFNWGLVSAFGRSRVASLTIATPFIGYIIIYHSKIDEFLNNSGIQRDVQYKTTVCNPLMTSVERLNFLYLGLTLLGIGSIVFRIFAPQIMKNFLSMSEFVENELQRTTARNLRGMFMVVQRKNPKLAAGFTEHASWLRKDSCSLKIATDNFRQLKDDQIQIDVLQAYYEVNNRQIAVVGIFLTAFMYFVGFSMLAIPSLSSTFGVVCEIYNS